MTQDKIYRAVCSNDHHHHGALDRADSLTRALEQH